MDLRRQIFHRMTLKMMVWKVVMMRRSFMMRYFDIVMCVWNSNVNAGNHIDYQTDTCYQTTPFHTAKVHNYYGIRT